MTRRRPRKRHVQQELPLARRATREGSRRGGKRKGAGRKPNVPGTPGVAHRTRVALSERHGVHVTLRVRRDVPNLRRNAFLPVLTDALSAGKNRSGFRLCHYVIMGNHPHLIVEADDASCLARGLQGWHSPPRGLRRLRLGDPPVVLEPRSWLLRDGWRKAGTIAHGWH
jgi:hypothetical protein